VSDNEEEQRTIQISTRLEREPKNVHSIETARTRRATAQMMRGRGVRERPL
jgi:hypothetical protein